MNYTRALLTSIMFYIGIAVIAILLMEFGHFTNESNLFHAIFTLLSIPLVLLAAKWYFHKDSPPTAKKGLGLGIIVFAWVIIFDIIFRVPQQMSGSIVAYYSDWKLLGEYLFDILLFAYAGFEFDDVYTQGAEKGE
ncbi:MAG: hypothetical protein COV59_02810 [Candidatus Magasanikbacteria bacterium CG11_big_fil_rev_8_21_14_0_20_39_34]|uniref:Uncharacterized protein n=1 Tax=Candidatus Magasanikbacteria bacterium CG11_big_fil_rev_8_21_14_0_20_39_34 TaxID=1974653 RepID=A0A2H0N5A9_9BACT|nr:MAG: hypothetical protein COV59_02810 [Candidatus Magasanikbacteria bacterium CG11_big_fil_rev_8_21_14_0_20_39_34]